MAKVGRRRSRKQETKSYVVSVRLTEAEYGKLKRTAEKSGLTVSQYLRTMMAQTGFSSPDTYNPLHSRHLTEVARWVNLACIQLSQIARAVKGSYVNPEAIRNQLSEIKHLLVGIFEGVMNHDDTPQGQ